MIFSFLEGYSNATPKVSENCQLHCNYGSDPKINENSVSGGGGMRSVRYPMKSEVQGGLYPDDGDKGRLLFSYRIALEQYLKKYYFTI